MTEEPPVSEIENKGTWYGGPDLEILRASTNEIIEIQPELSMFGSLKIIDVCLLLLQLILPDR